MDMLDYDFLDKCSDPNLIRAIVRKLKSGEEGHYPNLEKVIPNDPSAFNFIGLARPLLQHPSVLEDLLEIHAEQHANTFRDMHPT